MGTRFTCGLHVVGAVRCRGFDVGAPVKRGILQFSLDGAQELRWRETLAGLGPVVVGCHGGGDGTRSLSGVPSVPIGF